MRILAIGDIHGCSSILDTLLAAVSPAAEDTLVTLGDYVDRGPDSKGVLERLLTLSGELTLVPLRGNHDQMLLNARDHPKSQIEWQQVGGAATIRSYGSLAQVPPEHWRFLESQCRDYWECETHFFVHANVYPHAPLAMQPAYMLYWERFDKVAPHMSGKIMVCGHTSQKNGLPRNLGFAICLDTFAYGGGWLSCLDIASGQVWQANHAGEVRQFLIQDRLES